MKSLSGRLTDEDVQQIVSLVRELEQADFEFVRLEFGALKLTLSRSAQPEESAPGANAPAGAEAQAARPDQHAQAPAASASRGAASAEGGVAVEAPTVGRFYAQAEPGAAPFVRIGSEVEEDTTVGIIEVMKVFNAVTAGVRGVISEICVADAQFVEYGQILFRVRPTPPRG